MSKKPWIWAACRSRARTRSAPAIGEQVRHELRGDRDAALVLAVLAGVAVVGDDGRDARGAGPLEAVEQDEQLHQVLVDRRAGRLDDVHVPAAHVLVDADGDLAVGEVVERDLAERVAEAVGDLVGEGEVGPAAEDLDAVVVHAEACHRLVLARVSRAGRDCRRGDVRNYERERRPRQ